MNILKLEKSDVRETRPESKRQRLFDSLQSMDRLKDRLYKNFWPFTANQEKKRNEKIDASYTLPSPLLQKYNLFCVLACKTRQFCKIWIVIFSEGAKNIGLAFVFFWLVKTS